MIIGYNENTVLVPYDYSDCTSFMEAAVMCMQECGVEERELYNYLNEAVNIKEVVGKSVQFIKSWLSKILGIIQNVRNAIVSKIAKFKNVKQKESDKAEFSIEGYDYNNKFTEADIKNFDFLGNHAEQGSNYVSSVLKKWTGKDNQTSCTVNDIKEHIHDTVGKITITQDTAGYSFDEIRNYMSSAKSNDMNAIKSIEKAAKDFADTRIKIMNEYANKQENPSSTVKDFNRDRLKETMKFASLNTNLITALLAIVTEKITLNNKVMSIYTSAKSNIEKDDKKSSSNGVSNEFKNAVSDKKVLRIRIMIKDSLLVDRSFKQADAMIRYAKNISGLFDAQDDDELIMDKSKWNEDYMNREMVRIVNNFSHERLNHLKKVVSHIYNN